jgi:hypothetical protein
VFAVKTIPAPLIRTILVHYRAFNSDSVFVYSGPIPMTAPTHDKQTRIKVLETIFRECNHVDGTEWIEGRGLRSMSAELSGKGDQVIFLFTDGTIERWECKPLGWVQIEDTP